MRRPEVTSHLWRQRDDRSVLREGGDPVREVLAAGGEHRAVGSEALTLHQYRHITQRVPATLLVQAAQHMRGMYRGLKCKHRGAGGRHGHQGRLHVHTDTETHTLLMLTIYPL